MPRAVLFLAAFLSLAHAQAPRTAVYSALAPAADEVVPLADLIKGFDAPARTRALETLDRLDRAPLGAKDLGELSEAYRLLGRADRAIETASIISTRGGGAGDSTLQVQALANSGDFKGARAAAEAALKKYPTDPNLLAAYHQVKNRAPSGPDWMNPTAGAAVFAQPAPAAAADSLPFVLPIKVAKVGVPPAPGMAYVAAGADRPWQITLFARGLMDGIRYMRDTESPQEKQRMGEMRAAIDRTETGRQLVADLGGWENIDRKVDMRYASIGSDRTGAYAAPGGRDGKPYRLVINQKLLNEPDAVSVPVVAHEMSHLRDFIQNHATDHGLAIPSEFAAHRTQVQIFEELREKMSPAELAAFNASPKGSNQNFITLLWEDHLLQRFPNADALATAIGNKKHFASISEDVMRDLRAGMQPGGFQLDHHINGEKDGLYRTQTLERDIVDIIKEREAAGNYSAEDRKLDQEILARRNDLIRRSDQRDAAFRAAHGFQLGAH